jgi:16S rRNA (cytosine967-C5)-methyltransferase
VSASTKSARRVALDALSRIDIDGAYANLVLPPMLDAGRLDLRDRAFVTELVYGTTRMRRACDWAADRFVNDPDRIEPVVRNVLRLGTYQLLFLRTPAHAAVATAVDLAPDRARGLVNAVLRKVAAEPVRWPDPPTRLSYPDWVVARLATDLGADEALGALEEMNVAPGVEERADGYVQDRASQWVADYVGARPDERVCDLCAAPGGKATAMAASSASVTAIDVHAGRARMVARNAARLGNASVATVVADGRRPPHRSGTFDRVLVDAPCSGLGVLRRRPDARWHVQPSDVDDLVTLQRALLTAAAEQVRARGTIVYAVCTLTNAETVGIDQWLGSAHPELTAVEPLGEPWEPVGRGARLLPQTAGTDGMFVLRLTARR